jgi:subtilisin family serine protease
MLEAWDIEPGDPNVIVAIIDMGFDVTHSDLQNNIWKNPGEIPDNGIDDDQNGYIDDIIGWDFVNQSEGYDDGNSDFQDEDNDPTMAQSSHGNEVFGVLGATTNNSIGIAGVTGRCKMMLIRAGYLNTEGKAVLSGASISKGIIYATDNGAHVINISSGSNKYSNSYHDVLKYAIDHGVVIVCSAGNEGSNSPVYPAAYDLDGLISVGATTDEDKPAQFSNWGEWVDISAPGQHIVSTMNNDRYGQIHGTSFAAPIVAGIAALLVSHYPDWTPAQIKAQIMATADVLESLKDTNATSGRVNAYRALLSSEMDDATDTGSNNNTTGNTAQPEPAVSSGDDGGGGGCFLSLTRETWSD